jgi:hypothetical protein
MRILHRVSRWLEETKSIIRLIGRWLDKGLDAARRQFFQAIAFVVTFLLLISLMVETLKPAPEAKTVGALVLSLLTAAFLASFGKEVAGRIKKIGPIELLEAQKAARELDEMAAEVIKAVQVTLEVTRGAVKPGEVATTKSPFTKIELSARQQFYYREGDKLLTHLKFSGSAPEAGAGRDIFWELLFNIASTAITQLEWMRAIRWLQHLEKISGGSYRPDEVSNWLAFSNLGSALTETEEEETRQKHLRETVQRFSALAKKGELDYQGYFWLAYAQDELEQWYEAALSNFKTIKRRPYWASARYNLANSLLKLGKCTSACRQLKKIELQDEEIDKVVATAAGDEEMRSRVVAVCEPTAQQQLLEELDRLNALRAMLPPHP